MNKDELRKTYLQKRKEYNEERCLTKSRDIADRFFNTPQIDLKAVSFLHLFLPIQQKMEVDTFPIFHKLVAQYPWIRIVLSKCNFSDYSMSHFIFTKDMELLKNKYGIPEPVSGQEVQADTLDVVLVPLVLVDHRGNRIGYGKGFYDRFLAQCRPGCLKIGLSFDLPVAHIEPEAFDVPLDLCITPEKVFDFRETVSSE